MHSKFSKQLRYASVAAVSTVLLQITPALAGPDLDSGIKLYQSKDMIGAKAAFERAVKANPADYQAYYYLGHIYYASHKMAQAKYNYELCMHYGRDPGTQALCKQALASVAKFSPGGGVAAAPAAKSTAKTDSKDDDDDEDDGEEKVAVNPVKARQEAAKAQVMQQARNEVEKIRKEATDQIAHEKSNSNEVFVYRNEGNRLGLDISDEREKEIMHAAEERCNKIMQDAELRCRGFK